MTSNSLGTLRRATLGGLGMLKRREGRHCLLAFLDSFSLWWVPLLQQTNCPVQNSETIGPQMYWAVNRLLGSYGRRFVKVPSCRQTGNNLCRACTISFISVTDG